MVFAKSIRGNDGKIMFPGIGALIGYFAGWTLTVGEDKTTYTLSATLGYINMNLWNKTEWERRIVIQVGKDVFYRLEQADGAMTDLKDRHLTMEGITLHQLKGD